jgi:hypothetical protein
MMQGVVGILRGKRYKEVRLPSIFKITMARLKSERDWN